MSGHADIGPLPPHLAVRCDVLRSAPPYAGGYVLWWAHHALRDHDNACLDAALWLGQRLGLPVLAYAGLHGAHPYASDRHHAFILQALADWQSALEARGVHTRVSLPVGGARSPLPALAADAAAVVVEQFPVPPMVAWTRRLAHQARGPVWAMDARCIVPAPAVAGRHTRAYRFRDAIAAAFDAALASPWPACEDEPRPHALPALPGAGWVRPADTDLAALLAAMPIDHAVGPVADTPGGMAAGYARWHAFRDQGLARYHRDRNDPVLAPPQGVSRLSPYLHYGCVSALAIAREAHALGGPGARKFLDELVVWRELAHHFCRHAKSLRTLDVLPDWARETLLAHADDAREREPGWEALARARSGDALWDLAQRSLLVHGELHNNMRMTWGKAIVQWTDGPAQALDWLLDLNHRYALDGCDPNSWGGLLWCLGQFDRPFPPERPVLGTVRPRDTATHRRRLTPERWAPRIDRPNGAPLRIAVIGAGAAGAMAARTLADHGHAVCVLDKGRGPGGRTATRREGALRFDHGAQYLTFDDPRLARLVTAWREAGLLEPWPAAGSDGRRVVPVPAMKALVSHLLADIDDCRFATEIVTLERRDRQWVLHTADGALAPAFDVVLVTAPAPQAATLLEGASPELSLAAAGAQVAPCWTLMIADPTLALAAGGDTHRGASGESIAWAARDAGKPGRDAAGGTWVVQASVDWSMRWLELDRDAAGEKLWAEAAPLFGVAADAPPPGFLRAHRWRYARVIRALDREALWDDARAVGAGGDWCLGPRVECALLSGAALAGRVLCHAALAAARVDG